MSPLLSAGLGIVTGAIKQIWLQSINNRHEKDIASHANAQLIYEDRQKARAMQSTEIQFTRRIIALIFVCSFLVIPALWMFMYPDKNISVPVQSIKSGFWIFSDDKITTEYVSVSPFAYVAGLIDCLIIIVTFYFGSGGTRK